MHLRLTPLLLFRQKNKKYKTDDYIKIKDYEKWTLYKPKVASIAI